MCVYTSFYKHLPSLPHPTPDTHILSLSLLAPSSHLCSLFNLGIRPISKVTIATNPPVSRGQSYMLGLRVRHGELWLFFRLHHRGQPCGFLQCPRASLVWLVCNVNGNWKLRPGLMMAIASLHLLAQPNFPGICSDYFQSVLRRARALVQPVGHGWG